jgi:hypothetical protein
MTPELRALLEEAVNRLDMAFCLADDARAARRFAETRVRIRGELRK